jgi:methyl-accepting chemotaxis protein
MVFLRTLSLKHQVWAGLIGMLLLTALVASISLIRLHQVKNQADHVALESQPTMLAALQLKSAIKTSVSDMALYIINKDQQSADAYKASITNINSELDIFQKMPLVQTNGLKAKADELKQLISQYMQFQQQLGQLAVNRLANFPGIELGSTKLNPLSMQVLQEFENIFDYEFEENASSKRRQLFSNFMQLRQNWMSMLTALRAFYANPTKQGIEQINVYINQQTKIIDKLKKQSSLFTFEQEEGIDNITNKSAASYKVLKQIFSIYNNNNWRNDQILIREQIAPLTNKIEVAIEEIVNEQIGDVRKASEELLTKISNTQSLILALLIISIIIGLFVATSNSRQINTLVTEISQSLQSMSEGDFTIQLDDNRVGVGSEINHISKLINNFANKLGALVNQMQTAITDLQGASDEMSTLTVETSNNIMQQHRETEMVATAVEEMSATAHEVAQNAASAAESAGQVNEEAQNGAAISNEARSGMNVLITDLNNASSVIQNLQSESENISVVLDVIRSISEQTNLLALNAAIEAARAGEQGRGFAVVADEVRTLASRTQESTDQIKELIDKLQSGSTSAVDVMKTAIEKVNTNNDQVARVAGSLSGIACEIGNINSMIDQMAAASEEQSATSTEISRNVVSISQLAEQSAQGSERINSADEKLSSVSTKLDSLVSNFKT